jgi:hypothetical protein
MSFAGALRTIFGGMIKQSIWKLGCDFPRQSLKSQIPTEVGAERDRPSGSLKVKA